MSRWNNKNRVQNFAIPLDSLVKEKENTNRPVAARSAGTVGKWGTTSFTSIRTVTYNNYGYSSFSPKQDNVNPNISPKSNDGNLTPNSPQDIPKPKKFFKSRNVPDIIPAQFQQSPASIQSTPPSYAANNAAAVASTESETSHTSIKARIKINKKQMKKLDEPLKQKIKAKKVPKFKEKVANEKPVKVKPVEQPTRKLSRARKPVNYSENRSRTPSPLYTQKTPSPQLEPDKQLEETQSDESVKPLVSRSSIETASISAVQTTPSQEHLTDLVTSVSQTIGSPTQQKIAHEHPPIVLRISKGTSRLISTDSEELIHSPPYSSPKPVTSLPTIDLQSTLTSTAELLAVLSDDLPSIPIPVASTSETLLSDHSKPIKTESVLPPVPVVSSIATTNESKRPKSIKIKIKTKLANAFLANNGNDLCLPTPLSVSKSVASLPIPPPPLPLKRSTRLTRRNQLEEQFKTEQTMKNKSPQPGNDNYELYRTLASPSDKDFDSQSSIQGSISSTFAPGIVEDCQVICSQGSSHITSDQDTSQNSSLVAPPSEIDDQIAEMMECDTVSQACFPLAGSSISQKAPSPLQSAAPIQLRRTTRRYIKSPTPKCLSPETLSKQTVIKEGQNTKKNSIGLPPPIEIAVRPPITKSYSRKRKVTIAPDNSPKTLLPPDPPKEASSRDDFLLNDKKPCNDLMLSVTGNTMPAPRMNRSSSDTEYKKYKKIAYNEHKEPNDHDCNMIDRNSSSDINVNNNLDNVAESAIVRESTVTVLADDGKPSVKLVISKKKGSIFKSRAIDVNAGDNAIAKPKRHVYRHKWDDDKDKSTSSDATEKPVPENVYYDAFDDEEGESSTVNTLTRVAKTDAMEQDEDVTRIRCDSKAKTFYTVVRNVKKAHQIQEIGEFQEMDDDVDYILDALQPHNPMATRCLSAIQLASKCMTPAFRMHVRAHGTITKFFKALDDAKNTQSLGLCTATVMFVLNQDNLNMDLDRDSLGLMLNLLESDVSHRNALDDCGLTIEQLQRNKQKVKEICSEIKGQGKAIHLNLDNITVGTLAMETLLSLTSKRAGEWFKEELRTLGGLEKIIETICECCRQISDYVVDWTDILLEKLRKIERCLRVLENVSTLNEENQAYILSYRSGLAVDSLVKFYKLCDSEIALYPTSEQTPKDNPGVVLREALVPTLKVLINLTHPYSQKALGSVILGKKIEVFDTSLHLLLQATHYVPERCIFELSILVLLLLINLTTHTMPNRTIVMEASAPSDFGNQFDKVSAIKALIEYFYNCEELARQFEQNTDAILDNPKKSERKQQSQEEVDETVTKLLQKAGHHMENTMIASYVSLFIGYLIMDSAEHQHQVRQFLKNRRFTEMVQVLEKYYNFMNLTASSEASAVAHIKQTKLIIEYLRHCDTDTSDESGNSSNRYEYRETRNTSSIASKISPASTSLPSYKLSNSSTTSPASEAFFSSR